MRVACGLREYKLSLRIRVTREGRDADIPNLLLIRTCSSKNSTEAKFVDHLGAMQRGGNICLQEVRCTNWEILHSFIHKSTAGDTGAIYADEWPAYLGMADKDTQHKTIKHRDQE